MLECFENALRQLNDEGYARDGDLWPAMVKQSHESLESQYRTLGAKGRAPIDYTAPSTQAAYVYYYGMPRALYAREFLGRHRRDLGKPLFAQDELKVVSFGGGPASELVGLVQYLDDFGDEGVQSINYHVLDKDGEWEATARNVIAAINSSITLTVTYHTVDFADNGLCKDLSIKEADLAIFSYIASELSFLEMKNVVKSNLNNILSTTKSGSRILFIESKFPDFIKFFKDAKGFNGRQKNDNDDPINIELPALPEIYRLFFEMVERPPRTSSDFVVSKWYVKT